MSKIQINLIKEDSGFKELYFTIDGKKFVAIPKKGEQSSWIDEFKKLLDMSSKHNLNPYATPLKSDPIKADGYKRIRMFERVRYSWNDDSSPKEGARRGLKDFIMVVPIEKKDNAILEEYTPKTEQMNLFNTKRDPMKEASNEKDSAWGAEKLTRQPYLPQGPGNPKRPSNYGDSKVEEILNPHMVQKHKHISEHSDKTLGELSKLYKTPTQALKKACIEKLDKLASILESKGLIKKAYDIDVLSNSLEANFIANK